MGEPCLIMSCAYCTFILKHLKVWVGGKMVQIASPLHQGMWQNCSKDSVWNCWLRDDEGCCNAVQIKVASCTKRLINHWCHSDATQASLLLCTVSHLTLVTNTFLVTEESGWEYPSVYQSKYEINAIYYRCILSIIYLTLHCKKYLLFVVLWRMYVCCCYITRDEMF